jgi:spore maturation protein CgeB
LFSPDNLSCHKFEDALYKVFTVCPFTADWLNKKFNNNRRSQIYVPFNEMYIPSPSEKIFDAFYAGSIPSNFVLSVIDTISKFKYCFISYNRAHKVTHIDSTYKDKLSLLSQSKIAVVHNVLFPRPTHLSAAKNIYSDVYNNVAFDKKTLALTEPIMPQLKSRVFEAAFCKTLILCCKDPWGVVEKYFTPGKEFVYFEPNNLERTIKEILSNFDQYKPIIENAYNRAVNNYTTAHFFNTFLKDL